MMKHKKTLKKTWIAIGIILLLALAGLIIFLLGNRTAGDKKYCTEDSRNYDACIEIYEPVCGYPFQKTYSNSCFACIDRSVEFYVEGECK